MKSNISEEERTGFVYEAELLLERGHFPEALDLAMQRFGLFPADAGVIACSALVGMGRLDESRQILREVGELISGLSLVYERAGDIYREKGYHRDAAACYEHFISLHPDAEKAREVIGKMALLEQDDHPEAVHADTAHHENIPEQEFFTTTLAELYIQQGHLQDAEIILEEVIKKEPHNLHALSMLESLKASVVLQPTAQEKNLKNENMIKTLSSWLKNIEKLRTNAV